jgi:hypothetical protein
MGSFCRTLRTLQNAAIPIPNRSGIAEKRVPPTESFKNRHFFADSAPRPRVTRRRPGRWRAARRAVVRCVRARGSCNLGNCSTQHAPTQNIKTYVYKYPTNDAITRQPAARPPAPATASRPQPPAPTSMLSAQLATGWLAAAHYYATTPILTRTRVNISCSPALRWLVCCFSTPSVVLCSLQPASGCTRILALSPPPRRRSCAAQRPPTGLHLPTMRPTTEQRGAQLSSWCWAI